MTDYVKTQKSRLFLEELDPETKDVFEKCIQECVSTKNDCIKKHPKIIVYGNVCHQRRNVGMFSDDSDGYTYSGQKAKSSPLTENMKNMLTLVNKKFNLKFNGILVNEYLTGEDYIGAHSDDETDLSNNIVVAISWGHERKFRIRNKKTRKIECDINTVPYHYIVMEGDFQKEFTHEIPIQKKIKEKRISFTFRCHQV